MKKTYAGRCHCGDVRFEADIDLSAPTYRCNCSICSRTRFWPAIVAPEDMRVIAGHASQTRYVFGPMRNEHYFCPRCGVRCYGIGHTPDGRTIYGVNLGCLEGVDDAELAAAPVVYVDGRHDRHEAPAITAHL
jgi:hypothetical protein